MIEHVAIVGGGFSGTLQAINLLRHRGPRATLIERAAQAGEGLAYGAASPEHLLNVRAGNMSAFPDEPDHFVRWLAEQGVADPAHAFAPRRLYGRYLRALLDRALAESAGRLTVRRGEVVDADVSDDGVTLTLSGGGTLAADAAVLAVGNLPPHHPPGLDPDGLDEDRYRGDPWAPGLADGLSEADTVLIVGTGLTMVDVVLSLDAHGYGGRIVAQSRRGLVPHVHADVGQWDRIAERPVAPPAKLVRIVRERAAAIGWRRAVDELRPYTQGMWAQASDAEHARFVRHLRPWWDIHRHRLAPPVAARIAELCESARLVVLAGRTISFRPEGAGVAVTWRPRGADTIETLHARRVVNCTGPLGDLSRSTEPLLQRLVERGRIRPDSQHLGIDVDPEARTIAAEGTPNERLFALGPMTRGAFWEIVAVPDIRQQTWTLARRLSNAHWVGGEGL